MPRTPGKSKQPEALGGITITVVGQDIVVNVTGIKKERVAILIFDFNGTMVGKVAKDQAGKEATKHPALDDAGAGTWSFTMPAGRYYAYVATFPPGSDPVSEYADVTVP